MYTTQVRAGEIGQATRRIEALQRKSDSSAQICRSADTCQHFPCPRKVFAEHAPANLFPNETPDREARQSAVEAIRKALGKPMNAPQNERIAYWKIA